ncbi:DUF3830 family protein [Leucobacter allii]|uniref:DUF3830 family protein n=1 Tax=Leucobacter allii TaxID=2932247 RepID=A0ABY4FKX0_9MICO|nr:DUF3830 family protein [Leucobacter allii]UOQ56922.1 DUF3830 family protein [Leucobacter allii]
MTRYITITLVERGVSCRARLLDDAAPRTADAVWDALPQEGQVYHGKYARNEIYNLVPAFASEEPGPENTTITPIPRDVCYFSFTGSELGAPGYGYRTGEGGDTGDRIVDLAVFYGRNNLLINGDRGWIPGNVFAEIEDGFGEFAAACQDLWMNGAAGETLRYERAE